MMSVCSLPTQIPFLVKRLASCSEELTQETCVIPSFSNMFPRTTVSSLKLLSLTCFRDVRESVRLLLSEKQKIFKFSILRICFRMAAKYIEILAPSRRASVSAVRVESATRSCFFDCHIIGHFLALFILQEY